MSKKEMIALFLGSLLMTGMMSCGNAPQNTSEDTTALVSVDAATDAEGVGESGAGSVFAVAADAYDFGQIQEGGKVEHEFVFTNEGTAPLIVQQVTTSCGCTVPEYSKHPVAPGGEGKIKVIFDSEGQLGQHHKVISVVTNSAKRIVLLHLRGEVAPKS